MAVKPHAAEDDGRARPARVTIRDVAELAGVSAATVSRVMNGHPEVSGEVRESVLKVVRERGYTSTRNARPQRTTAPSGLVGVTLPVVHHSYFSEILAGASEAFYEQDRPMVLSPTLQQHDREASLVERLMQGITDGALLVLPEESAEELSALHDSGYPFVIVDPRIPLGEHVPTVSAAHSSGAGEAVEHLLRLGHRRIAAITGPDGFIASDERLRGYRGALGAAGVTPDPRLQVESDFELSGGRRAAMELLSRPDRPTAIFAFNDMLAVGAMQAARELGLSIPGDVSIVGFDDTFEAQIVTPTLTTVRQPLAEMGRIAVSQLIRLLENHRIEALHIELATRLIVRESTGPAPD